MEENTITIEFTEAEFKKLCLSWSLSMTTAPCQCPSCSSLTEKLEAGAEKFINDRRREIVNVLDELGL